MKHMNAIAAIVLTTVLTAVILLAPPQVQATPDLTPAASGVDPGGWINSKDGRRNIQLADQCGTTKQSCNDPAFPSCRFNPQRQEYYCCARDAVFCAAGARSYCCPAGKNCFGNGSGPPYCY